MEQATDAGRARGSTPEWVGDYEETPWGGSTQVVTSPDIEGSVTHARWSSARRGRAPTSVEPPTGSSTWTPAVTPPGFDGDACGADSAGSSVGGMVDATGAAAERTVVAVVVATVDRAASTDLGGSAFDPPMTDVTAKAMHVTTGTVVATSA